MTVPVNDHLFGELLKPVAEDYFELARQVVASTDGPGTPGWAARVASMDALETVGERIAKVLEVAAPEWEAMRGIAGLEW